MEHFFERYGPWAVVAGASEGIGASFSRKLAARGFNLVLLARRADPLEELAQALRSAHGVEVRPHSLDLASSEVAARLHELTEGLDVGLLIYNAAFSPIGAFLDIEVEEHEKAVAVNVLGPLRVSHYMGRRLAERGKGGIILMSSMSGFQGTAMVANYAATKAYDTVLAEGLWYELGKLGVDVLGCIAGATATPNYEASTDRKPRSQLASPMAPDEVTEQALRELGQRATGVSGRRNRIASAVLTRLFRRERAIRLVSKETEHMYR
jgi:short-subunit dehydrogenase